MRAEQRPPTEEDHPRHATVRYVALRVAFLLQDLQLRPGVGAVVAHAAALDGAAIVLTREQEHRHWAYPGLDGVRVLGFAEAMGETWDVAVCSGGATASAALALRAEHHACLLVEADEADGVSATALPLSFLVPTRAAAELVAGLQPGSAPLHVPTPVVAAPRAAAPSGVLEVAEAVAARPSHAEHARAIASAAVVVALAESDPYDSVLLARARGTPVVATTTSPFAEAVEHGVSGALIDPGDALAVTEATARAAALTPAPEPAAPSSLATALPAAARQPSPPAAAVARRVAADLATAAADAEALRHALALAQAPPPPPPPAPPSFARRAARAAKRRLRR
jgi:glycosyltransferase involved in cell wall biosynthesis